MKPNENPADAIARNQERQAARKAPLAVTMPNENWHVVCGWLESLQREGIYHVPTSARDLATLLREKHFPV